MRIDYQIIKRYLDDKGNEEVRCQITQWFCNLEVEEELREKSRTYWDELPENEEPENYDESIVLGRIYREIKIKESGSASKSPTKLSNIVNFLARIAAVLFIPLLILFFTRNDNILFKESDSAYTEIYSPLGARTLFYLPDGSKGWLNGGSSLKYPVKFYGRSRNVTLSGEAYFEVKTNPRMPFVVTGNNLNIIARGTSFNVSFWDDDPVINVVLVEGKLEVVPKDNDEQTTGTSLIPGQLLHYVHNKPGSFIKNVDPEKYISWIEGRLVFRDDPFNEVVKRLNRWYNVEIVIKDEILLTYEYVATFQDETLDEVLHMLRISAPIRYKEIPRDQFPDGTFKKRTIELYYDYEKRPK